MCDGRKNALSRCRLARVFGKIKGFTIVELITVIAIIAILAGILMVSIGSARKRAKESVARSDIQQLEQALEVYAQGWGRFAPDDDVLPAVDDPSEAKTQLVIAALEDSSPANRKRGGPFLNLPADKKTSEGWLDPWSRPYRYWYPTSAANVSPIGVNSGLEYNIWSVGADGVDNINDSLGTNTDDVRNWK